MIEPAGLRSQGILSASYLKDGSDPQWNADRHEEFYNFLAQDDPKANKLDAGWCSVMPRPRPW